MKLTPPKTITFWVAVVLGLAGLLGYVNILAFLTPFAFWLVFVGLVLLVLSLLIKGPNLFHWRMKGPPRKDAGRFF